MESIEICSPNTVCVWSLHQKNYGYTQVGFVVCCVILTKLSSFAHLQILIRKQATVTKPQGELTIR